MATAALGASRFHPAPQSPMPLARDSLPERKHALAALPNDRAAWRAALPRRAAKKAAALIKSRAGSEPQRPKLDKRLREQVALRVERSDPALAAIYRRCFDTLEPLISVRRGELQSGRRPTLAFISTGDIPQMWLRDSTAQLLPYLRHSRAEPGAGAQRHGGLNATHRPTLELAAALLRAHTLCLSVSIYANNCRQAFSAGAGQSWPDITFGKTGWNPGSQFELDSIGAYLELSGEVWARSSGAESVRSATFDADWRRVVRRLLALMAVEQQHETLSMHEYPGVAGVSQSFPELSREGRGTRVRGGVGLIWSGFTPGDDSPALGYVPSSMLI